MRLNAAEIKDDLRLMLTNRELPGGHRETVTAALDLIQQLQADLRRLGATEWGNND